MSELIRNLQGLADEEHDDVSVAYDAIHQIVEQRLLITELVDALEYTASLLEALGGTALTARKVIAKAKGESDE